MVVLRGGTLLFLSPFYSFLSSSFNDRFCFVCMIVCALSSSLSLALCALFFFHAATIQHSILWCVVKMCVIMPLSMIASFQRSYTTQRRLTYAIYEIGMFVHHVRFTSRRSVKKRTPFDNEPLPCYLYDLGAVLGLEVACGKQHSVRLCWEIAGGSC
jgi:hypothetical protein